MPEFKWFGHSCFRIRGRDVTILADPVTPDTGYLLNPQTAHIVTFSHPPTDELLELPIEPGFQALTGPGEYEIRDVQVRGIRTRGQSSSDSAPAAARNTIYVFEIEDLVVAHLGRLGSVLTEDEASEIGSIDILLIPVGGGPALDASRASEVISQLEPTFVIPMLYRTEQGDLQQDPLDRFLKEMGLSEVTPKDSVSLKRADLTETAEVIVLRPVT